MRSAGRVVGLTPGAVLCEAGAPTREVYFPLAGFVSAITMIDGREGADGYLIGDEGMVGAHVMLDVDESPMRAQVQVAGNAVRIDADEFRQLIQLTPAFGALCMAYLSVMFSLLSQTAACNARHNLEQRLARWLLMAHDRVEGDAVHITHQVLSAMIGVRRPGVSDAARALESRGAIHHQRGVIQVIDRGQLEAAACPCYEAAVQTYARVLSGAV